MKKGLALFIILLLTINLVSAGETFRLDFTTSPAYTVGLNEGDRVEFKLKDSLHTIILKETAQGNADIAIFTNISDNNLDLKVPIYKRSRKAITATKQFLLRHLKKEVNIGPYLNQYIWQQGNRHPPARVKVRIEEEKEKLTAELIKPL